METEIQWAQGLFCKNHTNERFRIVGLALVFIALTATLRAQEQAQSQVQMGSWSSEQLLPLGYQAYHERNWLNVIKYLSKAALSFPDNDLLYLYLGTAHQILGEDSLVEQTLVHGVNLQGGNMQKIAFVLGNYYYSVDRYDKAVDAYNLAAWGEGQLVQAFLNRANLYLSHGFYSNALNDYVYFLFRKPFDPQREKIEVVIEKLTALGAQGRIQADGEVIYGNESEQYPSGKSVGNDVGSNGGSVGNGLGSVASGGSGGEGIAGSRSGKSVGNDVGSNGGSVGNGLGSVASGGSGGEGIAGSRSGKSVGNDVGSNGGSVGNGLGSVASGGSGGEGIAGSRSGKSVGNDVGSNGGSVGNGLTSAVVQAGSNVRDESPSFGEGQAGAYQENSDGYSNTEDSLQNGRSNSLSGIYRRPVGDSGNTVGSGGGPEAQTEQLARVRRSLRQLNQSAIILSRERPEIIEQAENFSGIDE